jgi:hypothetical protein
MEHPTFILVTRVEGNTMTRGVWINPAYIVWADDLDSSPNVVLHMSDGTEIEVTDWDGDNIQGYLHSHTYSIAPPDETSNTAVDEPF